jgi:putative methionine-R-sulfoxide reductase with GAF domain
MHDPARATPWTSDQAPDNKADLYGELARELDALLAGEPDPVANAANVAAAIFHALPELNWAGFYFLRRGELVLGPFQGRSVRASVALRPRSGDRSLCRMSTPSPGTSPATRLHARNWWSR